MKGIVLAGGSGTRLLPLTKVINKHLLPVYDKPLIYYPLEFLRGSGLSDIIITTNKGIHAEQIQSQLKDTNFGFNSIDYVYQEAPLGTAHAVSCCRDLLASEKAFVVIFGDNICEFCIDDFINRIKTIPHPSPTLFVKEVSDLREYGKVMLGNDTVEKILPAKFAQNKPGMAMTGIILLDPSCFDFFDTQQKNIKGEFDIVDTLINYVQKKSLNASKIPGYWIDAASSIQNLAQSHQLVQLHGSNKPSEQSKYSV